MALVNITPQAAMAVEDYLGLFDNNTMNNSNATVAVINHPYGYALPQIVVASIVVTLLMIIVVVGNMLVIIAITTEKALKNIQNWFIASLAVADFFLGLIIMPFSLANELMGYWIFGPWWCDIHSAMDVLLSTASIMNLCLISLDRYWSITQAVEYLKKRTPLRAIVMIAAVWILSAIICIPPLLGWKVTRPSEERYPQCQLSEEIGYVLYSALGSFYIPSCIMVFVYIRIYYAAKARARRGIRKNPRKQPQDEVVLRSFAVPLKKDGNGMDTLVADCSIITKIEDRKVATIDSHPRCIPSVTCDLASDISTSDAGEILADVVIEQKDTLKVISTDPMICPPLIHSEFADSVVNGELQQQAVSLNRIRQPFMGIDSDMVSEFEPSSSDSGVVSHCAVVKPLKLKIYKPIFGKGVSRPQREKCKKPRKSEQIELAMPRTIKPKDPEREKRRIARKKEKRATLILGLIMGSFIACWLPFFFLYILRLIYIIPGIAFSTAFWLGYMNSALNPVIYTIFNKDFRRAFRRILFK